MQVSFKYQIDKFTISYLKYTLISASVQNIKKKTNICLFRKIATMKGFHLRTDITIKTIKIMIRFYGEELYNINQLLTSI